MRQNRTITFIKLTFFSSFFVFFALNFVTRHGFKTGMLLMFLSWSSWVMCFPFFGGGILFYPLRPFLQNTAEYRFELMAWVGSFILNLVTFVTNPSVYYKAYIPHLLYWIITHPISYWLIFVTAFLPVVASYIYTEYRWPKKLMLYYQLRLTLMMAGLICLFYLTLNDLIILSNIHA